MLASGLMKRVLLMVAAATALVALPARARDDRLRLPLADALGNPEARAKLDPKIWLYFGAQKHAAPVRQFGTFSTNKKTNFFNKSDKEGCEWAFLSAAIQLQERARREGGNAVVNIVSVYKDIPFSSETQYECGAGNVVGGVALRGEVVQLP
jgi:hypothetical protein